MSNVTKVLGRLMEKHTRSLTHAAATIGTSTAVVSRLATGINTPSHESMRMILTNLCKTEAEKTELSRAFLLDQLEAIGAAHLLTISSLNSGAASPRHALHEASMSLDSIAAQLTDIVSRATLAANAAALASGLTDIQAKTLPYHAHKETPRLVAEEPSKKKPITSRAKCQPGPKPIQ